MTSIKIFKLFFYCWDDCKMCKTRKISKYEIQLWWQYTRESRCWWLSVFPYTCLCMGTHVCWVYTCARECPHLLSCSWVVSFSENCPVSSFIMECVFKPFPCHSVLVQASVIPPLPSCDWAHVTSIYFPLGETIVCRSSTKLCLWIKSRHPPMRLSTRLRKLFSGRTVVISLPRRGSTDGRLLPPWRWSTRVNESQKKVSACFATWDVISQPSIRKKACVTLSPPGVSSRVSFLLSLWEKRLTEHCAPWLGWRCPLFLNDGKGRVTTHHLPCVLAPWKPTLLPDVVLNSPTLCSLLWPWPSPASRDLA